MAHKKHHKMKKHHDGHMKAHDSGGSIAGEMDKSFRKHYTEGMIHEDHSCIANLPQNAMIKQYGRMHSPMNETLDDTIKGVDYQIGSDDSGRNRNLKPHKY